LHLNIKTKVRFDFELNSVDNELLLIGNNCKKLKELKINYTLINGFNNKNMFEIFGNFNALEKLDFESEFEVTNIANIKSLKSCKNLKSLKLCILDLNDEHLNDIDLYLANLKYFYFNARYGFGITHNLLYNLAKIQHLLKFHLRRSEALTDSGVCYLITNSPNIKTILLGMTIKRKTIKSLIKRAKKKIQKFSTSYSIQVLSETLSLVLLFLQIYF
jgi:hypothetical protein